MSRWLAAGGGSGPTIAVTGLASGTGAGAANATKVQSAINAAGAAGGGTVVVPVGDWTTAPLVMKSRVRLVGLGWGSVLRLADAAEAHMVTMESGATEQIGIEHIRLDGNKAGQTGDFDVLRLDATGFNPATPYPSLQDSDHFFDRVLITNASRHGVALIGALSQSQFRSCYVYESDANNFRIESPDNHFIECVSAMSGTDGFSIVQNSNRFLNCKVWLAGQIDASNGSGFRVVGVSRIDLIGCEAQDNRQHGYSINGASQVMVSGCRADRNGLGATATGFNGAGLFVNNLTSSSIDVVSGDRNAGGLLQMWGYQCAGTNSGNIVRVSVGATATGDPGNGSFGLGSDVTITYAGAVVRTVNTQTASYTLTATDYDVARVDLSSASAVTLTVPPNSTVPFPIGTKIPIAQAGAGQITVAPGAGVTVSSRGSVLKLAGQNAVAELEKTGTNTWRLYGDITA